MHTAPPQQDRTGSAAAPGCIRKGATVKWYRMHLYYTPKTTEFQVAAGPNPDFCKFCRFLCQRRYVYHAARCSKRVYHFRFLSYILGIFPLRADDILILQEVLHYLCNWVNLIYLIGIWADSRFFPFSPPMAAAPPLSCRQQDRCSTAPGKCQAGNGKSLHLRSIQRPVQSQQHH